MLNSYFKNLYSRTMNKAYQRAYKEIINACSKDANILDCGAGDGSQYQKLMALSNHASFKYYGIEWSNRLVEEAKSNHINISHGDLNKKIEYDDDSFDCVFALSLVEHLINPCRFLREAHRVLKSGGKLVILTPNISTYFTAALIIAGKMPSSGPHPDSNALITSQEVFRVSQNRHLLDTENESPEHRHLIVFSYRVLKTFLMMLDFEDVSGFGFGLYPFPNFTQPLLEKIDPFHCHQLVFVATKVSKRSEPC